LLIANCKLQIASNDGEGFNRLDPQFSICNYQFSICNSPPPKKRPPPRGHREAAGSRWSLVGCGFGSCRFERPARTCHVRAFRANARRRERFAGRVHGAKRPLPDTKPRRSDAAFPDAHTTRPVLARNQPHPKLLSPKVSTRLEPAGRFGGGGLTVVTRAPLQGPIAVMLVFCRTCPSSGRRPGWAARRKDWVQFSDLPARCKHFFDGKTDFLHIFKGTTVGLNIGGTLAAQSASYALSRCFRRASSLAYLIPSWSAFSLAHWVNFVVPAGGAST